MTFILILWVGITQPIFIPGYPTQWECQEAGRWFLEAKRHAVNARDFTCIPAPAGIE